jgi:hypothetical protein
VKPYILELSAKMAVAGSSGDCIESGDDLDPVLWSAFGRTGWVGVDGRLTGTFFFLFIANLAERLVVKKRSSNYIPVTTVMNLASTTMNLQGNGT